MEITADREWEKKEFDESWTGVRSIYQLKAFPKHSCITPGPTYLLLFLSLKLLRKKGYSRELWSNSFL